MNSFEELSKELKNNITNKRYIHSLGVVEKAEELSKFYGADVEKARIAALLHDCAKNNEKKYYEKYKDKYSLHEEVIENGAISHQILGRIACKEEYKIDDEEIISSIAFHTTAKKNMSKLDKIIYVSDAIEKNRIYPGVESLREKQFLGLDNILIEIMDNVIMFLVKSDFVIDYRTIDARNFYIEKKGVI